MAIVHTHMVDVRWSDFDRYGHLMNANYIEIAQEARLAFAMDHIFPTIPGFTAFVRNINVDFSAPIMPQGLSAVEVITTVSNVGRTSYTTRQEIKAPRGPVSAVVECVQVAIDVVSHLPRPLTEEEKAIILGETVES